MGMIRRPCMGLLALFAVLVGMILPASAQQSKPNIVFIMGDDIGWMQPSIYHRGLMVGETPNIRAGPGNLDRTIGGVSA